jgi:hypothetical protein
MKFIALLILSFATTAQASCTGWTQPFFSCPPESHSDNPQECYCQCDVTVEEAPPLRDGAPLVETLDYYLAYPWLNPGRAFRGYSDHELFMAACSVLATGSDENMIPFELLIQSLPRLCDPDVGSFLWDYGVSRQNGDELERAMAFQVMTELDGGHPGARQLAHRISAAIESGELDGDRFSQNEKKKIKEILRNLEPENLGFFKP